MMQIWCSANIMIFWILLQCVVKKYPNRFGADKGASPPSVESKEGDGAYKLLLIQLLFL